MKKHSLILIFIVLLMVGCNQASTPTQTPTQPVIPTSTLPEPVVETTDVPDPQTTAQVYLNHWKAEEYSDMYALLTRLSQDAINEADFTSRYQNVANEAALSGWDYEI